jgi:hypothetical protein
MAPNRCHMTVFALIIRPFTTNAHICGSGYADDNFRRGSVMFDATTSYLS